MEILPRISTPRADASRETAYREYLNTPEWRRRRDLKLRTVRFRCERCGSKLQLEVHHRTYDRLGAERLDDLEALCGKCHGLHHFAAETDSLGIYYRVIADVVRALNAAQQHVESLADLTADIKARCAELRVPYDSDRLARAMGLMTEPRLGLRAPRHATHAPAPEPIGPYTTHAEAVVFLRTLGMRTATKDMDPCPAARAVDHDHHDYDADARVDDWSD